MRELTYLEAVREAMVQEMRLDDRVFLIGEDVGVYGGAFGVSMGMIDEFGPERVIDTPISELGIAGAITGAAMTGMRPIGENHVHGFHDTGFRANCQPGCKNPVYVWWNRESAAGTSCPDWLRYRRCCTTFSKP